MHVFCQEAPRRYGLTKKGEQTTDEGKTASREEVTEHKRGEQVSQEDGEEKTQDKNWAGGGQKAASPDQSGESRAQGRPRANRCARVADSAEEGFSFLVNWSIWE